MSTCEELRAQADLVLEDPERIEQLRSKGLEALPYLEQHIESCYEKFYDYVVDAVAKKSI